jgi:hypothetical protein
VKPSFLIVGELIFAVFASSVMAQESKSIDTAQIGPTYLFLGELAYIQPPRTLGFVAAGPAARVSYGVNEKIEFRTDLGFKYANGYGYSFGGAAKYGLIESKSGFGVAIYGAANSIKTAGMPSSATVVTSKVPVSVLVRQKVILTAGPKLTYELSTYNPGVDTSVYFIVSQWFGFGIEYSLESLANSLSTRFGIITYVSPTNRIAVGTVLVDKSREGVWSVGLVTIGAFVGFRL